MGDQPDRGGHSHLIEFPEALEAFFTRIGELKVVLGVASGPGVDRLEAVIQSALAARDRGDVPEAVARILQAMELLADLAGASGAADAAALRGMAAAFRQALAHGALGEAKAAAETMREESGSRLIPKKPR